MDTGNRLVGRDRTMIHQNIKTHKVTMGTVITVAKDLMSEHGENPEYDRALVELVAILSGFSPADHRDDVAELIGKG